MFSETPCRSETSCRMNNYSTRWSTYQLRREIRRENPSILRLGRSMTEPALRRQAARAVHDFKTAFAKVMEGIRIWNNEEERTFRNYVIYTDAADVTVDKIRYAEALLNHYAEVRTGHQDETSYEDALRQFINDNLGPSTNSVNNWFTTTGEYVAEQWRLEEAEGDSTDEAEATAGADHNGGEMITNDDEIEEIIDVLDEEDKKDGGTEAAPADTPSVSIPSPRSLDVSAPSAEHDDREMVTDRDVEDILDTVEDENKEDDAKEVSKKDDNGLDGDKEDGAMEDKDEKEDGGEATTEKRVKPAEVEQKEMTVAEDAKTAAGSQEHLLPYCLSLQDGAAELPIWFRKVRTYFLFKNLSKEKPDRQWAALSPLLDDDMRKVLHQEMKLYRRQTNLENMLAAVQRIFDEVFPRCVRCGETEG